MPKVLESPRQRILDTARQILLERGYEQLNIREVARICGLSVGTIYNYFSTKHELVVQIMRDQWNLFLHDVERIAETDSDIFAKLREIHGGLSYFIYTFHGLWVKANVDHHEFHTKDKLQQHKDFLDMFLIVLAKVIQQEVDKYPDKIQLPVDTDLFASFVLQNFIVTSYMKQFDYATFETILCKLILV